MIDSMEAMKVISAHRGDAIVVATMTAKNEWYQVSTRHDLDFLFSGAMGKASSLALGLALAQPRSKTLGLSERKVIVIDGDGSLLMNLGSLVTVANMAPPNLIHFVVENGVYRITGGQPIPNARNFSFAALAKEAGYARSYDFQDLTDFQGKMRDVIEGAGPTFVCLRCPAVSERSPYRSPNMTPETVRKFRTNLSTH